MKKLFPTMIEAPDSRALICGTLYWIVAFFALPYILTMSSFTTHGQPYEIWMELGYHILNFLLLLIFFFPTLKEAFFMFRLQFSSIIRIAGFCACAIILYRLLTVFLIRLSGSESFFHAAFGSLITTETDLIFYSSAIIDYQPVWGTLCLVLMTPVTTTCLLYGCVFAPMCIKNWKLAYPLMAFLLLFIRLMMAFLLWPIEEELAIFVVTLPVHLLACWSYQKTDNIYTPIMVHILANLTLSLLTPLLFRII